MEWLLTALPLAIVLLGCVGMHFFMMRFMHGGHGSGQQGHSVAGVATPGDRVAQLEDHVRRLEQELDASRGTSAGSANGRPYEPVSSLSRRDDAPGHGGRGCH